jgi:integrase
MLTAVITILLTFVFTGLLGNFVVHAWQHQNWLILERAKVPHVGTHGIRHRTTTEIANSGVPVKVGMQLTAHKTVTQFMRYVHTEDDPVRAAAETVASRRLVVLSGQRTTSQLAPR